MPANYMSIATPPRRSATYRPASPCLLPQHTEPVAVKASTCNTSENFTAKLGESLPPGDEHAVSVSLAKWSDTEGQSALVIYSAVMASTCQRYLRKQGSDIQESLVATFHVHFDGSLQPDGSSMPNSPRPHEDLFFVTYPDRLASEAKALWQHTGFGISSRCASYWLINAPFLQRGQPRALLVPLGDAQDAALALRHRLAALYPIEPEVDAADVYLYPTGMCAITHAALALYVDTFKVLSKVHGFECTLYSRISSSYMDGLEADLKSGLQLNALFTDGGGFIYVVQHVSMHVRHPDRTNNAGARANRVSRFSRLSYLTSQQVVERGSGPSIQADPVRSTIMGARMFGTSDAPSSSCSQPDRSCSVVLS